MGSCVSLHKPAASSDSAAVKLRLSDHDKINDQRNLSIPPSPVKHNPDVANGLPPPPPAAAADVALRPLRSPSRFAPGSKEEAFFDSQPWLDSDCEDDFLSVNGDFTPSRGNTPVHHKFSSGNQQLSKAASEDVEGTNGSLPEPPASPGDKKKRLSELFQESLRREEPVDDNVVPENPRPEFVTGGDNQITERTSNGVVDEDGKTRKSPQCCLPRLISSRSYSERKKKMSPARSLG